MVWDEGNWHLISCLSALSVRASVFAEALKIGVPQSALKDLKSGDLGGLKEVYHQAPAAGRLRVDSRSQVITPSPLTPFLAVWTACRKRPTRPENRAVLNSSKRLAGPWPFNWAQHH